MWTSQLLSFLVFDILPAVSSTTGRKEGGRLSEKRRIAEYGFQPGVLLSLFAHNAMKSSQFYDFVVKTQLVSNAYSGVVRWEWSLGEPTV